MTRKINVSLQEIPSQSSRVSFLLDAWEIATNRWHINIAHSQTSSAKLSQTSAPMEIICEIPWLHEIGNSEGKSIRGRGPSSAHACWCLPIFCAGLLVVPLPNTFLCNYIQNLTPETVSPLLPVPTATLNSICLHICWASLHQQCITHSKSENTASHLPLRRAVCTLFSS